MADSMGAAQRITSCEHVATRARELTHDSSEGSSRSVRDGG